MKDLNRVGTATEKPAQGTPRPGTRPTLRPVIVRTALGLGATALVLAAGRLPIWQAQFSAPQYPQGLSIAAYGGKVQGNLSEINELSHYIGMPPFNFVAMPEMRLWPLVILVGMVAAVLAVVMRRRWLRRLACATLWLTPVGALADVQFRLWQVGHSLDPASAIRVSPFTPRVLGPTTLMNFTVVGLPGTALVLITLAAVLVSSAPFVVKALMGQAAPAVGTEPVNADLIDAMLKAP
jgi:copper chaperone NosL